MKWTEAVTVIAGDHVPDAVCREVQPLFSEKELEDLTVAVSRISTRTGRSYEYA